MQSQKLSIDWQSEPPANPPSFLGPKCFEDYNLNRLLPYIDWNPFFQTWQLRGKYPNRHYPRIFQDESVGAEAKKLYDDAQVRLKDMIEKKKLRAAGVVAFYPGGSFFRGLR